MKKRFLSLLGWSSEEDLAIGGPFYLLLLVVMVVAYVLVLIHDPTMRRPGPLALFTGLMVAHGGLRLWGFRIAQRQQRRLLVVYLLLQGGLVFAIVYLAQLEGLILAFYMALVGESAGMLWPDRRAIALAASFYVLLLIVNVLAIWGSQVLVGILPLLGLLLAFVLIYVVLYVRQVQAREDAQALLKKLEAAHRQLRQYAAQVEELTIGQERQRMARELHDTLAQGLAGLILQLEAADSHLEADDPLQARAVVQQAMQRARTTLQEARRAIQALRPAALETGNLVDALGQEVDRFAAATGVRATFELSGGLPSVSPEAAVDLLRIVQEALSNVARHAAATNVLVRLVRNDQALEVLVEDDGKGFDPGAAIDQPDCFGLAGMQERAERSGGTLGVESEPGRGTRVMVSLNKGDGGQG